MTKPVMTTTQPTNSEAADIGMHDNPILAT